MALVPDPSEAGLWHNDELGPGDTGLHALIIGVSRYDHLADGALAGPGHETYGLGQLAVSAMTALRFFGWLRRGYTLSGWPVARVRLLLSPQKKGVGRAEVDELADCDPEIVASAQEATFENCKSAIRSWYGEMRRVKLPARGRSLLFFSGHGMQISRANQLLLPSDYGRPDGARDEVIRTQNLFDCLASLPGVPSHVVLLDACRNDIDKLRKVVGTNVIDESDGSGDPRLELRVLRATAFGSRAYQPTTAGGLSLFGQALLDGLSAQPNPMLNEPAITLSRRGAVPTVEITDLHVYMNGRIDALIKAAKEDVIQIVRADDSQSAAAQIDMTELVRGAVSTSAQARPADKLVEEVVRTVSDEGQSDALWPGHISVETSAKRKRLSTETRETAPARPGAWFAKRYGSRKQPKNSASDHGLHSVLGSEAFAIPWMGMRVEGLSTGQVFGPAKLRLVSAAQTTHSSNLHGIQAQIRIENDKTDDPVGYALTMTDLSGQPFCAILPTDRKTGSFELEIDRIGSAYIRFATFLSTATEGAGGRAAAAWNKMRALSAPAAATFLAKGPTPGIAKTALKEKVESPLAAIVGAALLLRANRLDLMRDWTRNLATWFETMPDGVVFWMEQCMRERRGEIERDATAWFVQEMLSRSLPFTCDGLGMAAKIVGEIERDRLPADAPTRKAVSRLRKRIDAVMPYFRDDGLFCAYAGLPDNWQPAKMLGAPKSRSAAPRPAPFAGLVKAGPMTRRATL